MPWGIQNRRTENKSSKQIGGMARGPAQGQDHQKTHGMSTELFGNHYSIAEEAKA